MIGLARGSFLAGSRLVWDGFLNANEKVREMKIGKNHGLIAALASVALSGCMQGVPMAQTGTVTSAAAAGPITRSSVIDVMNRVAKWQYSQYDPEAHLFNTDPSADGHPEGWAYATLYVGLAAHARTSGDEAAWERLLKLAERGNWGMAPRPLNADDYAIGQLYLDLADHYGRPEYAKPVRDRLEMILANPPQTSLQFVKTTTVERLDGRDWPLVPCRARWCWADALFMAPPVWMRMAEVTGDQRFAAYADKEFWAATDLLYDKQEKLYFRDSRFFNERTADGKKVFWGRGNGWTISGIARTLDQMPASVERQRWEALFRDSAGRLADLQTADGYWTSSLLASSAKENPETSGTALIVYAMAWGVNQGLLDRAKFEPVIDRGWRGLVRAVHPDGKLGYVQQVASAPGSASYDDSQLYGVGGFLMAGEEVAKLKGIR